MASQYPAMGSAYGRGNGRTDADLTWYYCTDPNCGYGCWDVCKPSKCPNTQNHQHRPGRLRTGIRAVEWLAQQDQ